MIDLPEEVNFRFNTVIQQQAGSLSYLIPNVEEFAEYKGRPRKKEFTFSAGKTIQKNKFRYILQAGTSTTETYVFKFSHYYRVIAVDGGIIDCMTKCSFKQFCDAFLRDFFRCFFVVKFRNRK